MDTTRGTNGPSRRLLAGGVAGLLAGAAAVTSGQAVAALLDGVTTPLLAVANRAVDAAPRPLKELAIATFGTADKPVLIGGVVGTVALLALAAGAAGVRRPRVAVGCVPGARPGWPRRLRSPTARRPRARRRGCCPPPCSRRRAGLPHRAAADRAHAARSGRPSRRHPRPTRPHPTRSPDPGSRHARGRPRADRGCSCRTCCRRPSPATSCRPPSTAGPSYGRPPRSAPSPAAGGVVRRRSAGSRPPRPGPGPPPAPARARRRRCRQGVTVDVDGVTPYLTANADFYRVDTALRVPDVPLDGWRLRIHGMVDRELDAQLRGPARPRPRRARITLTCVSNPVGGEYLGNADLARGADARAARGGRGAGRAPTR